MLAGAREWDQRALEAARAEREAASGVIAHLSGLITSFRAGPEAWPAGFVIGPNGPLTAPDRLQVAGSTPGSAAMRLWPLTVTS